MTRIISHFLFPGRGCTGGGFFLFDLFFFFRLHLSDPGPYSGSLVCALLAGAGPFWGGLYEIAHRMPVWGKVITLGRLVKTSANPICLLLVFSWSKKAAWPWS
jgi:hypothetical protein